MVSPGVIFKGKVVKYDGAVNNVFRDIRVYISIPDEDVRLIPGITVVTPSCKMSISVSAVPTT